MARTRLATFAVAALVMLAGATCGGGPGGDATLTTSSPAPGPMTAGASALSDPGVASSPPVPAGSAQAPVIAWRHTGLNHEIGVLRVPLDHHEPDGAQVALGVARQLAATPSERVGTLVLLPGGPGGSGLDLLHGKLDGGFDTAILDRFDIVSLDPRGVGVSTPKLDCPLTAGPRTWDASDPSAFDAFVAGLQVEVDACAARSGPLLARVGSIDVARDVDVLRAALGEEQVSLYGISYGTVVAQVYAREFPEHVRALVLDSPVYLGPDAMDAQDAQAAATQRAFDAFLAGCARDRACPFWSGGDPRGAYDRLVRRVDATPIGDLTGTRLRQAVFWGLTGLDRQRLASALAAAVEGRADALLALDQLAAPLDNGYLAAVHALDFEHPTVAEWRMGLEAVAAVAPDFVGIPDFGLAQAIWPLPATAAVPGDLPATGLPPVLVLAATGDASTPYTDAKAVADGPGTVRLVTLDASVHGVATGISRCADEALAAYLVEPGAAGGDVTCALDD